LSNVIPAKAGNYRVAISNAFNAVTSSPASIVIVNNGSPSPRGRGPGWNQPHT